MALLESSAPIVRLSDRRGAAVGEGAHCRSVIWLRGDYDIATVAALQDRLAGAIEIDGADVVVELADVTFMGAETVGVLIRARRALGLRLRSLELRSPSPTARRVLELCAVALVEQDPNGHEAPATPTPVMDSEAAIASSDPVDGVMQVEVGGGRQQP